MASASIDVDERLASMIYSQQLQEKQEMTSNAQAEFRRGLKELVRDHLHTCMALASCSNSNESAITGVSNCGNSRIHNCLLNHVNEQCNLCRFRDSMEQDHVEIHHHYESKEEEDEQAVHRRHRLDIEENDSAESSAARRHQSRILNRWAARQAQEMITTMERQAREAELLALAGLHTVSMMDSSFLRQSSPSRSEGTVERPSTRASSLVQMWRELEGEPRIDRARDRTRERMVQSDIPVSRRVRSDNRAFFHNIDVEERGNNTNNNNVYGNESAPQSIEQRMSSEDHIYHSPYRQLEVNSLINDRPTEEGNIHDIHSGWEDRQLDLQHSHHEQHFHREQSPDLGEGERERVRQIVQRWMTENRMTDNTPNNTHNTDHRAVWHGEIEQERVRELSREWLRVTSQQRGASGNRREQSQGHEIQPGLVHRQARQRESFQGEVRAELEENRQEYVNRNALRLRGRQAIIDLLMRVESERQRELEGLSEHRAVSDFSHRNRIQSLLRGRFLRTGAGNDEHRPSSAAAGELGQLRQRRTVSGLREGFSIGLGNSAGGQPINHSNGSENHQSNVSGESPNNVQVESHSGTEGSNNTPSRAGDGRDNSGVHEVLNVNNSLGARSDWQEVVTQGEEGGWQAAASHGAGRDWLENAPEGRLQDWQENVEEGGHQNWQAGTSQEVELEWHAVSEDANMHWQGDVSNEGGDWEGDASQDIGGDWQGGPSQDINADWQEGTTQESVGGWQDSSQGAARAWQGIPNAGRVGDFQSLEEATAYNMELRELLGRRSVSTVLASEFRERMDQLILSYIQRQGRDPVAWDLQTPIQTLVMRQEQGTEQQEDDGENGGPTNISDEPPFVSPPPPPPPPPHRHWRQEMQRPSWPRPSLQRHEIEWEAINDLRGDMARLQQGMSDLHRMLETCMDMQLELQRSVRQEVSAALNRSNGGQGIPEESIDGSKWVTVRKGICCICCDKHIDSLLYRCGHMCTCLKCANELLHNSGKCPMCRAPIVEVVRAYCEE